MAGRNVARLVAALPVASLARARDAARATFWLLPSACIVVSIGLAVGLVALDHALPASHIAFTFPGPPGGARSYLSSIIQAMIAFTGLVFSITIVVLQLSSSQFSPRVLRTFLSDLTIQLTLGVFVATFVYSLVVLRAVRSGADGVPRIAVTVAFLFVVASVVLFVRYVAHVANLVRVATVIANIGDDARRLLGRRFGGEDLPDGEDLPYGDDLPDGSDLGPRPHRPAWSVPTGRPGSVVSINEPALVGLAAEAGVTVVVTVRVGDFVPSGATLLTIHDDGRTVGDDGRTVGDDGRTVGDDGRTVGDDGRDERDGADGAGDRRSDFARRALRQVAIDSERTMEQDVAYGLRQLVDIAERALSPSVNDPTTASQAIDVMHDLLRTMATRPAPTGRWYDDQGALRVVVPQYAFADLLDLAIGEIWHYGAGAAQVPDRLRRLLHDLLAVGRPEHGPAVTGWLRELSQPAS